MSDRKSGVLCHLSSLPSDFGIGDIGTSAYRFVDFLSESKMRYWQILPINPTDSINQNSPYQSSSAFAANILFISPQLLVEDRLLSPKDISVTEKYSTEQVEYDKVRHYKTKIITSAFHRFLSRPKEFKTLSREYCQFIESNSYWLDDYALFIGIKNYHSGRIWTAWPKGLRERNKRALKRFVEDNAQELGKIKFSQFIFHKQWGRLKEYCHEKKVLFIGDIPIYMSLDSADVWAHPQNYKLNKQFQPTKISGVPPDYFSDTGQRWGNPVYNWKVLKKSRFSWWVERLRFNFQLFDKVRIDHFRGLVQYWEIPSKNQTAVNGKWVKVPTVEFFKKLEAEFSSPLPIIAEDLGYITEDVRKARRKFNIPGMTVLLFAFGGDFSQNPHLPPNFDSRSVVYTGTHDNNTVRGWYAEEATEEERVNLKVFLEKDTLSKSIHWDFISMALRSRSNLAVIPMQDILGLGSAARMNKPATMTGNWLWRFNKKVYMERLTNKLSKMIRQTKRM